MVKATGRAYIFYGPYLEEMAAYLLAIQKESRFEFGNFLIWMYSNTIGPTPTKRYINNWQGILYLVGVDAPETRRSQHRMRPPGRARGQNEVPEDIRYILSGWG